MIGPLISRLIVTTFGLFSARGSETSKSQEYCPQTSPVVSMLRLTLSPSPVELPEVGVRLSQGKSVSTK